MSYPVHWDKYRVLRDFVQNFYDSVGYKKWHKTFCYSYNAESKTLELKIRNAGFSYEWLLHIGASTKTNNSKNYAGYFGEGFKVAALCAIRDYNWEIIMCSQNWKLEVTTVDSTIDRESVKMMAYNIWDVTNTEGSVLEIQNISEKEYNIFLDVMDSFYYPENRLFGKKLWADSKGALFTRSTIPISDNLPITYREGKKGAVFCGYQMLGTASFPYVFCLHDYAKIDRERSTLYDYEVIDVVLNLATYLDSKVAVEVLENMKTYWCSYPRKKKGIEVDSWSPVVNVLVRNIWLSTEAIKLFRKRNPFLLCVDKISTIESKNRRNQAKAWAAKAMPEYRLVKNCFSLLGYNFLEDVCRKKGGFVEFKRKLSGLEEKCYDILKSLSDILFDGFFYTRICPAAYVITNRTAAYKGMASLKKLSKPKTNEKGIKIRYDLNVIYLKSDMFNKDNFNEALSTYIHEMCHMFGGDASVSFSNALTLAMEILIDKRIIVEQKKEEWINLFTELIAGDGRI